MANKYINAKDLELEVSHYLQCEKESETITLEELNEIVNRFPTADFVQVIRCKDCKHATPREDIENAYYCLINTNPTNPWYCKSHPYDYFCSDGERSKKE